MAGNTLATMGKIVGNVAICQAAGGIGAVATTRSIPDWYTTLKKPSFTPPNWAFGPVWTTLYTLMGLSAYLVERKGLGDPKVKQGLGLFGGQLFLNTLWTLVFFGRRSPLGGLIVIPVLWLAILLSIISFARTSKLAALLLVPYIMWTTIAAALNFEVWRLNR
jgi:translocator protein